MKNSNNQASLPAHSGLKSREATVSLWRSVRQAQAERDRPPGGCLGCSNHKSNKGRAPRLPFSACPVERYFSDPGSAGSRRDAERQRSPELLPRGRHKKRPRVWLKPGSTSGARCQITSSPRRAFSGPDESQADAAPQSDPEAPKLRTSRAVSREHERATSIRQAGAPAAVEKFHLPAGSWPRGHLPGFRGSSPLSTPCPEAVGSGGRALVLNSPVSLRRGSCGKSHSRVTPWLAAASLLP